MNIPGPSGLGHGGSPLRDLNEVTRHGLNAAAASTTVSGPPSTPAAASGPLLAGHILPIPHVARFQKLGQKRTRQTGSTAILTDSPYKRMLMLAATTKKSVPVAKKRLHTAISKKTPRVISSRPSSPSSSDTDESSIVDPSRDSDTDDERLMHIARQSVNASGDYVLVQCARKQSVSYYAGKIVRIDTSSDEIKTTFLKRNDLRKGEAVLFRWPDEEDRA